MNARNNSMNTTSNPWAKGAIERQRSHLNSVRARVVASVKARHPAAVRAVRASRKTKSR